MHLSRLELSITNRQVQRLLADPYAIHRALALACALAPDKKPGRILFRVEPKVSDNGRAVLLAQSEDTPDWERSEVLDLLPTLTVETKTIDPELVKGAAYHFRLRANPTVKKDGKRRALLKEEELLSWLKRKLEAGGANLMGATIIQEGPVRSNKKGRGKHREMLFHSARFEGELKVNDPQAVKSMVHSGLGSGKAFGFGLLSLAR